MTVLCLLIASYAIGALLWYRGVRLVPTEVYTAVDSRRIERNLSILP